VYGGAWHYGNYSDMRDCSTLNNLLRKEAGISGPVIHFVNFFDPDLPKIHNNISMASEQLGIQEEKFVVRTDSDSPESFRPDFIIHIPVDSHSIVSRMARFEMRSEVEHYSKVIESFLPHERRQLNRLLKNHHSEGGRHAVAHFLQGARRRQAEGEALTTDAGASMTVGEQLAGIESAIEVLGV